MRRLVTAVEREPTGVVAVECGQIPDGTRPELAALVGRGHYWGIGTERTVAAARHGGGVIRVGVSARVPADWARTAGIDVDDPDAARAALVAQFADWAPQFRELMLACEGPVVVRDLHVLPVGLTWPQVPGVTLLGDAAHLMPPVGYGANVAMLDGAELALALVEAPEDVEGAVRRYEEVMLTRAAEVAARSAHAQRLMLAPDGARNMLGFLTGRP